MGKWLGRALGAIKRLLISLGVLVLLFYATFFGVLVYQGSRDPVVEPDDRAVVHVLQWLHQEGDARLLSSYYPPVNWAGDYEKIFALELDEKVAADVVHRAGVVRGDQVAGDLAQALKFAMLYTRELDWFPPHEDILAGDYYVASLQVVHQGGYTDGARLLIVQPDKQILYFVAAKM